MNLLASTLFLFLSLSSFAKEGGNGGGAYTCGRKLELYDFYESREAPEIRLKLWKNDPSKSEDDYLTLALEHIKRDIPEVHASVAAMVAQIQAMPEEDLFVDIDIPFIPDASITLIDRRCYVQVANWNERFKKLFINKTLYGKLDNLNKAGLIIHEAIYKLSRDTNVATKTSDLVRKTVARIFSNTVLTKADAEVISSEAARKEATRPQCEDLMKSLTKVEDLLRQSPDEKTEALLKEFAGICLRACKIEEYRQICESKL